MRTALIVGSGPAAAAAALALTEAGDIHVTVVEPGLELEAERRDTVEIMAATPPEAWPADLVEVIAGQPPRDHPGVLPEKRVYGSDFPFRDLGQRTEVLATGATNRSVVSAAYGGFSNVWGAQVMPFAASVFDDWPVASAEMEPHYRRILGEIPYAGEVDDLSDHFPLLADARPLPPLSARSQRVLAAYARRRRRVRSLNVTVGKARLAFDADNCVRCGLCMTGCPYRLIYSASQTFDRLRAAGCVTYRSGLLATRVSENEHAATVEAVELASGARQFFEADRVYLACGAIGTTQLVARSLGILDTPIVMRESRQFTLPFVSAVPTIDPRIEPQFTLNQFNLTVGFDDRAYDLSQLHFYTFNPLFEQALPAPLRSRLAGGARRELLRRLSFAIGYLPSWQSPSLRLTISETHALAPRVQITSEGSTYANPMLRQVVGRLLRVAPLLDLYPVLPMLRVAGPAKSYHFGGSFPHASTAARLASDRVGRPADWQRVHLVDGSVLPTVPSTTFTLTVMANAHRIASESMELLS